MEVIAGCMFFFWTPSCVKHHQLFPKGQTLFTFLIYIYIYIYIVYVCVTHSECCFVYTVLHTHSFLPVFCFSQLRLSRDQANRSCFKSWNFTITDYNDTCGDDVTEKDGESRKVVLVGVGWCLNTRSYNQQSLPWGFLFFRNPQTTPWADRSTFLDSTGHLTEVV